MYAALRAIRLSQTEAAAAAADKHEGDGDGVKDLHSQSSPHVQSYSDHKTESDIQLESRKRKEENPEPDPTPEKVSRQDDEPKSTEAPSVNIQSLPPKKLNADGSFGDPRPKHQSSGRIPQPWLCPVPDCGRNNFQWRKTCPHCGTAKPPGVVSFIVKTDQEPPQPQPQPAPPGNAERKKNAVAVFSKPPAEVARGDKNNANLEGLGQKRGGIFGGRGRGGGGGSDGGSMAERLAKMAGMTGGVPAGFCPKEEEKSWADIKNKKSVGSKAGQAAVETSPQERTSFLGRGGFVAPAGPGRGRLGFGDGFGSFR